MKRKNLYFSCVAVLLMLFLSPVAVQAQKIESAQSKQIKIYALRLRPDQDVRTELERFARDKKLSAGFILTAVGSLNKTNIRLADQPDSTTFEGKFEIVSLVGTLSQEGGVHLHISLSDKTGRTIGGHLSEGCKIYTTAEIVIGATDEIIFTRETDSETTYKELKIRSRKRQKN